MEIGNRLAFEEEFDEYHRNALRDGRRYAVVMCDVDHFKLCNDNFGHQLGDDVLRHVAAAIRDRLRSDDAAFRYGGEEILLLLSRQDLAGAVMAAERIRHSVEEAEYESDSGVRFRVTVSCGVVCYPTEPSPSFGRRELVELADRALYEAKRLGRNRVVGVVHDKENKIRFATADEILGTRAAERRSGDAPRKVRAG